MNSKTTLSISEARKKIFQIAEDVQKPATYYTLTENGKPKVVIMSAEEFESWAETLEILSDPKALCKIKKVEDEFKKGEYVSWDKAKEFLGWQKIPAFMVMDKSKKQYSIKSKKRNKK